VGHLFKYTADGAGDYRQPESHSFEAHSWERLDQRRADNDVRRGHQCDCVESQVGDLPLQHGEQWAFTRHAALYFDTARSGGGQGFDQGERVLVRPELSGEKSDDIILVPAELAPLNFYLSR